MRLSPMGPEGIRGRIAEIKSKLEGLSAKTDSAPFEPSPQPRPTLSGSLHKAVSPSPLRGSLIPNPALAQLAGNQPINPLVGGMTISSPIAKGREAWLGAIQAAAGRHGVDAVLLEELVAQESSFNPQALSKAGAMGLTQLMPETAKMLGVMNPWDPAENLDGGAKYLAQMLKEFEGSESLALAAYNAGPGRVKRAGGVPDIPETASYVERITAKVAERRS